MSSPITPLCQQKASFLASSSVEKAGNIFGAAIFLVLLFTIILELLNPGDEPYELARKSENTTPTPTPSPPAGSAAKKAQPKNKWVLDKFLISTPLMALNGLSFAMIVLANQHSYYCEPWGGHGSNATGNWKDPSLDTPKDWVFIGLFPGVLALCGFSIWLRSATNLFLARWKWYVPLKKWPPALPIVAIVVPMMAAGMGFYELCLTGFKLWIKEGGGGEGGCRKKASGETTGGQEQSFEEKGGRSGEWPL